jgi:hypothetical protein
VPSHRANGIAELDSVPASTSPFGIASRHVTGEPRPLPSARHAVPSQRATPFTVTPPRVVKLPPTNKSPFGRGSSVWA